MIFFLLLFCCLHNETPCIGWEIQTAKTMTAVKRWRRSCTLNSSSPRRTHARTNACGTAFLFLVPLLRCTPTSSPPAAHRGLHTPTDACLRVPTLTPLHPFSPQPPLISDWPNTVASSDGAPIYALSGWSLFTCQIIRASCCGRSVSHEARASQWPLHRQSKH